tara:strand:- start:1349 stop:2395 length:1047 start_codon:yes stop_codon:yes gene_type:complete
LSKKVLVIGNLGYVGCVLNKYLFEESVDVYGVDANWFGDDALLNNQKKYTCSQIINDIRNSFNSDDIWSENFDAVIYLAAVSNDPMGKRFAHVTHQINAEYCIKIATEAKNRGVKKFIFASSCSMYGIAENNFPNEDSDLNPMTEYAKSKVWAESQLRSLGSDKFKVISLRFATACGSSPNLRLDLVLNDLVASAIINNHVQVLSDGTPWRPLVHVLDMSRAIRWAIDYNDDNLFLAVNIGSKEFTYQVRDFAKIVTECIPGSKLSIATDKAIDSRSYKVDFSLYESISGDKYYPKFNAEKTIEDLIDSVRQLNIPSDFRVSSNWMRLKYLENRIKSNALDENLYKIS